MITNFETKLASNLTLAISLTDAEKFHRDHEDIKPFVDVSNRTSFVTHRHSRLELSTMKMGCSLSPSSLVMSSIIVCSFLSRESANASTFFNGKRRNYPQCSQTTNPIRAQVNWSTRWSPLGRKFNYSSKIVTDWSTLKSSSINRRNK